MSGSPAISVHARIHVLISFVMIVQAALSASGADRKNEAILVGSILLTNTSRILDKKCTRTNPYFDRRGV